MHSNFTKPLPLKYIALAINPFLGPCYWSLLGVVCDAISDAAAEDEEAIGWMFPSSRGEQAKKGPIAKAQEGINSSSAFAFP